MGSPRDTAQLQRLFSACDVRGTGLVELEDFASVCTELGVEPDLVRPLFRMLDVDQDGIIDFQDFAAGFEEVSQTLNLPALQPTEPPPGWEELEGRLGGEIQHMSSPTKEWLCGFYQDLHGVPVPGILQQYEKLIENVFYDFRAQRLNVEKLESILKRTEDTTAKQMTELEEDLQHHLIKVESEIREEEQLRLNAAIQELQRRHETEIFNLQTMIDRMTKDIDQQKTVQSKEKCSKMKDQIFELSQENDHLKMNLLETQTNISLLQTELDRLKNDMADQHMHHSREKEYLKNMVEESRVFSSQIQILNEANKSLYDSNDTMRSALTNLENERKRQSSPSRLSEPSVITYSSYVADEDPYRKFSEVATWADKCMDSGVSLPRSLVCSDLDSEFGSVHSNSSEEHWDGSIHYMNSELETEVDGKLRWTSRPPSRAESFASSKRKLPAFTPKKNGLNLEEGSEMSSPIYRLVLAGDAGSGKSSFLLRLCLNEFRGDIPTTLGVDFHIKKLLVDGDHTTLQIWDTAGQERFRSIAKSYFRKAHGVLLMYDVSSERSFLNVRQWIEDIKDSCDKPIPMMLIANKTDLRAELGGIPKSVGEKLAMGCGSLFCETSAKDGTNVVEAVLHLAREVKNCVDLEAENKEPVALLSIQDKKANCCKI
ncbi:hypothetical protein GDO86_006371 [Hymenochirus boettgeri]|uniref:EF-hand domain-containing protein n=1 Tax=Hymenochirus boettgeri TaxID=247094 RepID=A0A8T2JAT4_9PIPI|nr:hypothetical protein GDO86_006371 [Hymenochirus boettgeri]